MRSDGDAPWRCDPAVAVVVVTCEWIAAVVPVRLLLAREAALGRLEKAGALHAANLETPGGSLTTDRALADERETIALMQAGAGRCPAPMRGRVVDKALRNGPLTPGQREAEPRSAAGCHARRRLRVISLLQSS